MARSTVGVGKKDGDGRNSVQAIQHSPSNQLNQLAKKLGSRARPDPDWVAQVVGCDIGQAEDAMAEIVEHTRTVVELCERVATTGRTYYAQFPAPIELYAFTRLTRPTNVVESGVASGVSSAFLLLGISANGHGSLHSVDFPVTRNKQPGNASWAIPVGLSSGWAIPPFLKKEWDLRLGRSERTLRPLLEELGHVDLFCHDSPVSAAHLGFEMKSVSRHLKSGSMVVADNTGANRRAFEALAESVGAEPINRRKSDLAAFRIPPP